MSAGTSALRPTIGNCPQKSWLSIMVWAGNSGQVDNTSIPGPGSADAPSNSRTMSGTVIT